tara:strand:+ start:440 stop:547 length:108 start_codon:yes stop_codon:yes gene_type:complete
VRLIEAKGVIAADGLPFEALGKLRNNDKEVLVAKP